MKINIKKIFTAIITVSILIFIFWKIDFSSFISSFKNMNYIYLTFVVLIYILTLIVRGFRWQLLVGNNAHSVKLNDFSSIFTIGLLLNFFLPLRAGDLYRSFLLSIKLNDSKMKIFGTVILEKIFDGLSIVTILFMAIILYNHSRWLVNLGIASFLLFFLSFSLFFYLCKYNKIEVFFEMIKKICKFRILNRFIDMIEDYSKNFLIGFEMIKYKNVVLKVFLLSLLSWIIESCSSFVLILAFNLKVPYSLVYFLVSFSALATMIPSASISAGPCQLAFILTFNLYSLSKTTAVAISLTSQILIIMLTLVISSTYLIKNNINICAMISEVKKDE